MCGVLEWGAPHTSFIYFYLFAAVLRCPLSFRRRINAAPERRRAAPAAVMAHRPVPVLASCLCGFFGAGGTVGGVTGGVGGTTGVCEFVTVNPEAASPETVDVYPCGTLVSFTV